MSGKRLRDDRAPKKQCTLDRFLVRPKHLVDEPLPRMISVDMDGTIADISKRLEYAERKAGQNSHYFKQNTLLSLKRSHDVEAHIGDRPTDDGGAAEGAGVRFIQVSASHWPTFEEIFGDRLQAAASRSPSKTNAGLNEAEEGAVEPVKA
ncbi:hypothetical protein FOL47_007643 [Perkinsus chesapeaki]|uniref:Uncharacterized protein n=1 Tax=Perkinsus chesapeaki TaxID=330153 RepID=A0A7J6MV74_PERCH|nr:hypothetical protein FOL47_007643 [Perkinsus chesapeaki]